MNYVVSLPSKHQALDQFFPVEQLPADKPCPVQESGGSISAPWECDLRVVRIPEKNWLIIWDKSDRRKSVRLIPDDGSDFREHLKLALDYFAHIR
jgi:hypothetical protein